MTSTAARLIPALLLAVALTGTAGCDSDTSAPSKPVATGSVPAKETVKLIDGGRARIPGKRPMLLVFLDPTAHSAASRSQIPTLKSMATQYGPAGLSVLVVDATGRADTNELINFSYDWNLRQRSVQIAAPKDGSRIARAYQADRTPDTLLITSGGDIRHRWRGRGVMSQELAPALHEQHLSPSPASPRSSTGGTP